MSVKRDLDTILKYKSAPEWVRKVSVGDQKAREQVEQHLEVLDLLEVGEEEIKLESASGSGSLFYLSGSWRVLAGEVEVLDERSKHFGAGAAQSDRHFTTVRLKPGTIVLEHYMYSATPSTYRHRLTVYYRPPSGAGVHED